MWSTVLKFTAGPGGALLGKIMLGLALAGLIWYGVHSYNEGIRETERNRNLTAQLEQVVKDGQELNKKLDKLDEQNRLILEITAKKNENVAQRHSEVNNYIQSPEAQKTNRESSGVLKGTIRMLQNEE